MEDEEAMDSLEITHAWLKLNALELSATRARTVLDAFAQDPIALFAADALEWRACGLTEKQIERINALGKRDFDKDLAKMERLNARLVVESDPCYPAGLHEMPDAPLVLMARGELLPEDKFSIAIVGSRRASEYGLSLAHRFSKELVSRGLTVISGGARGVDTRAHRGALDGNGRTVAFIGCGLDHNYPAENRQLFDRIADGGGAVVSEFSLGTRPEPWRFPARNRLISGMSLGVLVIESPFDSGSLITARQAGEQGREVFAIPGPIGDGRNTGCHKLIQDGAKLVENVEDILTEIGVMPLSAVGSDSSRSLTTPAPANLPPDQRRVLDLLTLQPRHVDTLIAESSLTIPQIIGVLTLLEMRGLARRVPGNAFVRVL
jgi:DNA processing protein